MKHLLLTTIAAVLVGCGESQQSAPAPEPPTGKAPDISILKAAQEGNIEAVKQHLAAGADVNAKDENGWTPLNSAAVKGRNQIVKLLIEKGADLNAGTPLIFAATDGHMEVVELLIANGADVNAKTNDQLGGTALHMTSNLGHKKAVELLVAAGADVNAKMLHGMTPLHFATNNKGIAKFLIDKGADVNAKLNDGPHNGSTPLDFANVPNRGDPEIAAFLRKHGGKTGAELKAAEPVAEPVKPESPTVKAPDISIHDAAYDGNIEAVKQHLAAGADVNAKEEYGVTPLHRVAYEGHKEIAELLIAKGADVDAKDKQGWTPLHFAAQFGHKEVVELLIAKGADLNAKDDDDDGKTPLDYADGEIADLLRKHGGKTAKELEAEGK